MQKQATTNGMVVEIITVTPEFARELLRRSESTQVRSIARSTVKKYADELVSGAWKVTGQGISIDKSGKLIDGFHRMTAVVETGIAADFVVCKGCAPRDVAIIDSGRKRRFYEFLQRDGWRNASQLASSICALYYLRHGELGLPPRQRLRTMTIDEGLTIARSIGGQLKDAGARVIGLGELKGVAPFGAHSAILYMAEKQMGVAVVDDWCHKLKTGDRLGSDDPIHRLRESYFKRIRVHPGAGLPAHIQTALLIKSWNAWLEGREIRQIGWRSVGPCAEPMPVPVFVMGGEQG